jgi:NADH-quinone oxidoreductase subunit J
MFSITVLTNNALYALSSLAAGMIFISAFFFLLNADFLGAVQVVVYTGAIKYFVNKTTPTSTEFPTSG